jgi:hypothetical protein
MLVDTVARESGYRPRTVHRALCGLQAEGHLERHFYRRRSDNYRRGGLSPAARRGQGPNVYRMGASLRARAGLREVEWPPDTPRRTTGRTTRLVAGPDGESKAPPAPARPISGRGGPRRDPVADADEQGSEPERASVRGTPRTKNERKPLSNEERLVPSSNDFALSSRSATKQEAQGRKTSEIVSLLPLHEALIVMEAEALVNAGGAAWVEPGWSDES